MALVTTQKMFAMAYKNGYAVGAFNVNNMEITQGIMEAIAEEKAPLILQISKGAREYAKMSYLRAIIDVAVKENPDIPICMHLDHGDTFELCKQCVDDGFTSVMIDASHHPFDENVKLTKQVVQYAHDHGVVVEAELGQLGGIEEHVKGVEDVSAHLTDPNQAVEFVKKTGCDSLAVAVGTSHGAYKFKTEPKLAFDVIEKIQKTPAGFPAGDARLEQRPEGVQGPDQQVRRQDAGCHGRAGGGDHQGLQDGHLQGQHRHRPAHGPDGQDPPGLCREARGVRPPQVPGTGPRGHQEDGHPQAARAGLCRQGGRVSVETRGRVGAALAAEVHVECGFDEKP